MCRFEVVINGMFAKYIPSLPNGSTIFIKINSILTNPSLFGETLKPFVFNVNKVLFKFVEKDIP